MTYGNLFNDLYAKDISKKVRSSLIVKKQNGKSEMVNSILRNENYTGILWQNELQKEKFITIALTTIEIKLVKINKKI